MVPQRMAVKSTQRNSAVSQLETKMTSLLF